MGGDYLMDANGTLDAVQKSVDNKIIDYSFDSDCMMTNQIEHFNFLYLVMSTILSTKNLLILLLFP